jgi:hypothetical protein
LPGVPFRHAWTRGLVGSGGYLLDLGARQGPADGHVQVRGEPFLRLQSGEVLHVVACDAAQILHEAIDAGVVDQDVDVPEPVDHLLDH